MNNENNTPLLGEEDKIGRTLEILATEVVYQTEDIETYSSLYIGREELEKRVSGSFKEQSPRRQSMVAVALLVCVLFFLGMTYYLSQNYMIKPSGMYNNFLSTLSYFEKLPSLLPQNYRLEEETLPSEPNHTRSVTFVKPGTDAYIKFTEADYRLTESLDGEEVTIEDVSIANRYKGTLIQKGEIMMLLWEQDGYFYLLLVSDSELSIRALIKIASSLE